MWDAKFTRAAAVDGVRFSVLCHHTNCMGETESYQFLIDCRYRTGTTTKTGKGVNLVTFSGVRETSFFFLRERVGAASQGVSWAVCGSGAPLYEFLNLYGVFNSAGFGPVFPEKRLDLKSLKGWAKAEELGARGSELLSLHPSLKAL